MTLLVYTRWWMAAAIVLLASPPTSTAADLIFGCYSRPACGKICKLVCEETTITAVGYGCECDTICIPGPSQRGCKRCDVTCCCDVAKEGCPPKLEFCWYDWFACGCAKPRTVKVLTKYQAEKKICSYHWEVVDVGDCAGGPNGGCDCVYKLAPMKAQVGEGMPLSGEEKLQLASWMAADATKNGRRLAATFGAPTASAIQTVQPQIIDAPPQEKRSLIDRLSKLLKAGE
jgi:hypothetical protein